MAGLFSPRGAKPPSGGPLVNAPRVIIYFLLVFVGVHVIGAVVDETAQAWIRFNFSLTPLFIVNATGIGADMLWLPPWLTLLTYAFLHADITHVVLNSLWFLVFGTVVARRVGGLRLSGLFAVSALVGGLVHVACHWDAIQPVIGASAAVAGLMGAAFRFILVGGFDADRRVQLLPLTSRPILIATLIWLAFNVVSGVTGFSPSGFGMSIAWEAHLGGYFAGLVLFPFFDRGLRVIK